MVFLSNIGLKCGRVGNIQGAPTL